jgi:hypothetical protein
MTSFLAHSSIIFIVQSTTTVFETILPITSLESPMMIKEQVLDSIANFNPCINAQVSVKLFDEIPKSQTYINTIVLQKLSIAPSPFVKLFDGLPNPKHISILLFFQNLI